MKMKKSALIGILVVSLVALLAVGTWAWFTAQAVPVVNTFTAGTVEISINDEYQEVTNWNPGDTTDKKVSVKNVGTKCAYVRVKLTPEWGDKSGEGGAFVADNTLATTNVSLGLNTNDWVYVTSANPGEGWYYYNKKLCPGDNATTPNLLNSVTLVGESTDNKYQGKVFRITVEAEAVQSSNDAYKSEWNLVNLPWENSGT